MPLNRYALHREIEDYLANGKGIGSLLPASPYVRNPTCGMTLYCNEKVADVFLRRPVNQLFAVVHSGQLTQRC